jgi:hypothetical protein
MHIKQITTLLVVALALGRGTGVASGQHVLSGGVYKGEVLDKTKPFSGITVKLHGSNNELKLETLIDADTTDASGSYELTVDSLIDYPYYYIVTTPPARHSFDGATSLGGTVKGSWIEYTPPLEGKQLAINDFWYRALLPNKPPIVDAGPDMSVTTAELPHSVELVGSAEDPDDGPDPLTVEWSKVGGPGAAVFDDPADPTTTVTFHASGDYVLRLSAFDGAATVVDEATIDVHQPVDLFRRSDTNFDDSVNIADAIRLIGGLFGSSSPPAPCDDVPYFQMDAADTNDDGEVDLSDAVYLLGHLFLGGPAPPAPYDDCGEDLTDDDLDSCYDTSLCDSFYKASSSPPKAASDAGFALDLVAPPVVQGEPGTSVQFEAAVRLTKAAPGVQGWSFGITSSRPGICRIIEATSERTAATGVDFAHTEIISRPQRPGVGAVGAAVLSRDNYVSLFELPRIDPGGEPRVLLRLTLEARIPERGSEKVTLKFVEGIRGKGQPVPNILAVGGDSVLPVMKKVTIELSTGLVGYWNFNEGHGTTAHDSSGFGNHGTLMGVPSDPVWVEGRPCEDAGDAQDDGALDLRGSGYVHCSNSDGRLDVADAITIAVWVRTDDCNNSEHNPYVAKGDHSYALKHQEDNNIEFFIYDRGWQFVRAPVDSSFNGVWHHLAGTYDGRDLKLYIDGALQASVAHTGSIAITPYDLNIGRNSEVPNCFYNGRIDEVRIYSVALEPAEIVRLITARDAADANDDGVVDYRDLQIMAAEWLFEGANGWGVAQQELTGQDIGDPTQAGSASYDEDTDTWTVTGSGRDIWRTMDQFHYVYAPLSGDAQLTTRIYGMEEGDWSGMNGVMFRETLAPVSRYAMMSMTAGQGAALQWRSQTGGTSDSLHSRPAAEVEPPVCLRIVRSGDTFKGYYSSDGRWIRQGSVTIPMKEDVFLGLAVTSRDEDNLSTAAFGQGCPALPGDLNGDGCLDFVDFAILTDEFLQTWE